MGSRWPATLTVLMGTVSVVLATTIVNVAIPDIMADFGLDQVQAQWLATGFLAAMTATMLASAPLMQRLGQQRTFIGALFLFVAASLLAAASWNATVMIAARILQGAVAGIIQPLAMVVIFQAFPDRERGRALGLYGMGVVLAPALGPALGGVLVDVISWRAVYLAPLPFCVIGLLGARTTLGNSGAGPRGPFDWLGLLLLAIALGALLTGLVGLSAAKPGPTWGLLTAVGAAVAALFLLREWRARIPLVELGVFRHPSFALAVVLALIYGAGLYASTYLLPLLVQGVQGMSATKAGLVMMPAGLALALVFPISGRLSDLWPAHWLIITGLLIFAAALAAVATTGPATGFWVLAVYILIGRVGLGVMMPPVNLDALRGLPELLLHQGSGVINFARQLGGAFGVILFSLLLQHRVAAHLGGAGQTGFDLHQVYAAGRQIEPTVLLALTRGFGETFIALGLLFLVAVIPATAMGVYRARVRKYSAGL